MTDVVELPPFTEDMRTAIRECRFKTVNRAHTQALVYDADKARMEATGLHFTAYRPAQLVWIADTWNCWREVVWYPTPLREDGGIPTATQRRASAVERCAELNAEHDAWLACA